MTNSDQHNLGRTLRGALSGEEPDEAVYFAYSASLRIFGVVNDLDGLTRRLGVTPTSVHRRGEQRRPGSQPYRDDMWSYQAPVSESEPLAVHIDSLWRMFRGHTDYLLALKDQATVDVFLGYRSNCDCAGIEVPCASLEMFVALQIPFGVSIIIT